MSEARFNRRSGILTLYGVTQGMYRAISKIPMAKYQSGRKRWVVTLSHEAVETLASMGFSFDEEIIEWKREQDVLAVCREKANALLEADSSVIQARLSKWGVRSKLKLYPHQLRAVAYALQLPACGLFMDTGTGKTATASVVMQALVDLKKYKRFLVIAPKTILDVGWGDDIDQFSWLKWVNISDPPAREPLRECPVCQKVFKKNVTWAHIKTHMTKFIAREGEERAREEFYRRYPQAMPPGQERLPVTTCPICHEQTKGHVSWSHLKKHAPPCSTREEVEYEKSRIFDQYPQLAPLSRDVKIARLRRALDDESNQVFLINPEAFKLRLSELSKKQWDMIFVDESSILKSPKSDITQKTLQFARSVKRRVCMTATPRPNSSLDLHGQMSFIDQSLGVNFYSFRNHYFMKDYSGFNWVPKKEDVSTKIWDVVKQRSYRVRLDDCVDLPGETLKRMSVDLKGKLSRHYQDMVECMTTTLKSGEKVTTEWKVVQLNKLSQITSGYVFDNDGNAHFLENSPKIDATVSMVKRLIEDEDRFVVIWVRFSRTEGRCLEERLSKYGVSTLHGQTRNVERSVGDFLSKKNRVMIANAQSAKFGHTWVHSNAAIFHSYDYSWENFYQAKRRIYRIGQKSPVTYFVCTAKGTIDEQIMKGVFSKERASESVVDGILELVQQAKK